MNKYFTKILCFICLTLITAFPQCSSGSPDYTKTPIVLVHGYKSDADYWDPMIEFLKRSGYPREYLLALVLHPNTGSNIAAAESQIAPAVEEHLEKINQFLKARHPSLSIKTKIDLLSKSMGALSCRWYASKVRPDRIRVYLSFGGAHHGTNALCQWDDQGARDCCPAFAGNLTESAVQYVLNGKPNVGDVDETYYGFGKDSPGVKAVFPDEMRRILYVSIRTYPDQWIKPEESAILDGAGGVTIDYPAEGKFIETSDGNILLTNKVGHDAMISNKDVFKILISILNSADNFY